MANIMSLSIVSAYSSCLPYKPPRKGKLLNRFKRKNDFNGKKMVSGKYLTRRENYIPKNSSPMKKIQKIGVKRPITTTAKKARIDRSLLFMILMSPVTKEPMTEIPTAAKTVLRPTEPDGMTGKTARLPKTMPNTRSRIMAAARLTDHLPKEVFGRTVIRMFITFSDT
jgi:hypothetical protein